MENKSKLFLIFAVLLCLLVAGGCGAKNEPTELTTDTSVQETTFPPEVDYSDIYSEVLKEYFDFIVAGADNAEYVEGKYSISESLYADVSPSRVLETYGYIIEDINGDDIPELIISNVVSDEDISENNRLNAIEALYVWKDGKARLVAYSGYMSTYFLSTDGLIIYNGYMNDQYPIFGIYTIDDNGALVPKVCYFSDDNGYYYSPDGEIDPAKAEIFSESEFYSMEDEFYAHTKVIDVTPFSTLDDQF